MPGIHHKVGSLIIRVINIGKPFWLFCLLLLVAPLSTKGATNITIAPRMLSGVVAEDPKQQPFLSQVLTNDVAGVKEALKADRSLVKTLTARKVPVLIYASILGGEMPRVLLEHGADPNARVPLDNPTTRDHSPLDIAALQADAETTELLLKAGADPNAQGMDKATPLQKLFQNSTDLSVRPRRSNAENETARQAVAKLLLAAGADPTHSGGLFGSAFDTMISAQDANWLTILAENSPASAKLKVGGDSLLHLAAKRGNGEAIRFLLGWKMDPNLRNSEQLTALQIIALKTASSTTNSVSDPFEPVGYWNLTTAGAEADAFSLAALGKLNELQKLARQHSGFLTMKHENGRTLLHWATAAGQCHVIQWLLAQGADPDTPDNSSSLPLHLALEYKQDEAFSLLLPLTKTFESKDKYGRTPLAIAFELNHDLAIREILQKAPDSASKQRMLNEEFTHFIRQGNSKPMELLLQLGADGKGKAENGQTALHVTVKTSLTQTKLLLELGMDANAKDLEGRTPLHQAVAEAQLPLTGPLPTTPENGFGFRGQMRLISQKDTLEIIKLLLSHGADIKAQDNEGNNLLHLTFQQQSAFTKWQSAGLASTWLDFLLEQGAEPNKQNKRGHTPLQAGINSEGSRWAEEETLNLLLRSLIKHKFDLNQTDTNGLSLIHLASEKNRPSFINVLLRNGAAINTRTSQGETPLMLQLKQPPSNQSNRELLSLLIKVGADAELLDNAGRSIWQIVCETRARPYDVFQQMLDAGIKPAITNHLGQNALHLGAKHKLDGNLIERFIKAGANPEVADASGRLPLHWLMEANSSSSLSSPLLKNATNLNAVDLEGDTPLHIACRHGNSSVMVNLLARGADISLKNKLGDTPLWLSVGKNPVPNSRSIGLFRGSMQAVHLLPKGITNDIINSAGAGDLATVKQLLALEPRLISAEREGHNALHAAAFANQREVVNHLLQAGAQMDNFTALQLGDIAFLKRSAKSQPTTFQTEQNLKDLLTQAARKGNPEISSWLIEQGAKAQNAIDPQTGISALGQALKQNQLSAAEVLRQNGAHPTPFDVVYLKQPDLATEAVIHHPAWLNQTNDQGVTPLMKAIADRSLECARALLENGADPNLETPALRLLHTTPLQHALQYMRPSAVDLLLEYKLDLKRPNKLGFTPVHLAVWYGSTNLLDYLLDHGIDINQRQQQPTASPSFKNAGQTALHLAVLKGSTNMITYLLQKGASLDVTNNLGQKPVDLLLELKKGPASGPPDDSSRSLIRAPILMLSYPPSIWPPRTPEAWQEIEKLLFKKP